jgi:hypothetical protein
VRWSPTLDPGRCPGLSYCAPSGLSGTGRDGLLASGTAQQLLAVGSYLVEAKVRAVWVADKEAELSFQLADPEPVTLAGEIHPGLGHAGRDEVGDLGSRKEQDVLTEVLPSA